jgi:hypothetical protein
LQSCTVWTEMSHWTFNSLRSGRKFYSAPLITSLTVCCTNTSPTWIQLFMVKQFGEKEFGDICGIWYQYIAPCFYFLLLRRVSASVLGLLQGARKFFVTCSLYFNLIDK